MLFACQRSYRMILISESLIRIECWLDCESPRDCIECISRCNWPASEPTETSCVRILGKMLLRSCVETVTQAPRNKSSQVFNFTPMLGFSRLYPVGIQAFWLQWMLIYLYHSSRTQIILVKPKGRMQIGSKLKPRLSEGVRLRSLLARVYVESFL